VILKAYVIHERGTALKIKDKHASITYGFLLFLIISRWQIRIQVNASFERSHFEIAIRELRSMPLISVMCVSALVTDIYVQNEDNPEIYTYCVFSGAFRVTQICDCINVCVLISILNSIQYMYVSNISIKKDRDWLKYVKINFRC